MFGNVGPNRLQACYRSRHSSDRWVFCLVFCGFRYSFSRQIDILSAVPYTVLGVRPTDRHSVWCFAVFGILSVDRLAFCLVFGLLSWTFARQISVLSAVRHSSLFVQSTDRLSLGRSGCRPGRSPDRLAFCLVFDILRLSFSRQMGFLSGIPDTVLGVRPTDWPFCLVFGILRPSFSRQISIFSGIPDTVLGVRPTAGRFVWCLTFFALRLVNTLAFRRLFGILRSSFS